jgi:uncharacterized phiE125 gp8 family phage protein
VEPFLVGDPSLRQQLRLDTGDTSQDTVLAIFIGQAREAAEQDCRRAFITQSWLMTMDKFPMPGMERSSDNGYGSGWGTGTGTGSLTTVRPDNATGHEISVPLPPLQTIDSIKYYDPNGVLMTLDPSQYFVDSVSEPARVTPAPGAAWPSTLNRANSVEVRFTAGWDSSGLLLPNGIRAWMLLRICDLFENREAVVMGARGTVATHPYIERLLDPYRVRVY